MFHLKSLNIQRTMTYDFGYPFAFLGQTIFSWLFLCDSSSFFIETFLYFTIVIQHMFINIVVFV
jgi:hypothetical protein